MRLAPVISAIGLVAMFSACNAILGNESHYELVGAAGEAGAEAGGSAGSVSGGKGGAAGSSMNSGGKSAGRGGSGTAGRGGAGGTGANGGSGGTDAAGEGGDDSAGAGTGPGTGGSAGAPACVPSGDEDCFNGVDDDCNGELDCEDSACTEPAECRPAPSGADLGFFAPPGGACPTGFTPLDLNQDLQAATTCTGCSCVSPTKLLCDSGVYGHGTYACPSYQFSGQLWNVFNDRCGSLPSDPNIHYYSIRGTSECTAAGTPTVAPASWATSEVFCLLDQLGGGCGPDMACLPVEAAETPQLCTLDGGGCTSDYATDRGTWYEGFDDERTCSDCSCGLGTADCTASYIGVYMDASCSTNAMPLQIVADQGDACGLSFAPQSAKIIGDPVPGSGSCEVNSFLSGEAKPANGHQVCCAP